MQDLQEAQAPLLVLEHLASWLRQAYAASRNTTYDALDHYLFWDSIHHVEILAGRQAGLHRHTCNDNACIYTLLMNRPCPYAWQEPDQTQRTSPSEYI